MHKNYKLCTTVAIFCLSGCAANNYTQTSRAPAVDIYSAEYINAKIMREINAKEEEKKREEEARRSTINPSVCQTILANKVNATNFAALTDALQKSDLKKREFENTEEYNRRVQAAVEIISEKLLTKINGEQYVVLVKNVSQHSLKYDADTNTLTSSSPYLPIPEKEINVGGNKYQTMLEVKYTGGQGDEYIGENAFGMQRTVSRTVLARYGMIVGAPYQKSTDSVWPETRFKFDGNKLNIKLTPEEAKKVKTTMNVLIVGRLASPYYIFSSKRDKPTMSDPQDFTILTRSIVTDPICITLYNSNNRQVYWSY